MKKAIFLFTILAAMVISFSLVPPAVAQNKSPEAQAQKPEDLKQDPKNEAEAGKEFNFVHNLVHLYVNNDIQDKQVGEIALKHLNKSIQLYPRKITLTF